MILSLRARVLLLVFLINLGVFGAGGVFLFRAQVHENERLAVERTQALLYTLKGTIRPAGEVSVVHILQWPEWDSVEDAILVDKKLVRDPRSGEVRASGVDVNPVGCVRRPGDFDRGLALARILEAIEKDTEIPDVLGGRVLPIAGPRGVWGGLWYRARIGVDRRALIGRLAPWFLLSTLALTAGTFLALRRLVLDPVGQLAEGARRVRGGDFSVQLRDPRRRDEMAELVRSFNAMTSTVRGFNERLEEEVRAATAKARQAEAAAMTQRRLAAMGELAAGIAHEINNPLGGLQNAVEALRRRDLDPEKRARYLELLARGLERIGETVRRLRRFTPRRARAEPLDLAEVAQDAVQLVAHRAERLGVELRLDAPGPGGAVVRGERNEIGQAILNLLANSLDALEEDQRRGRGARGPGRIEVAVRPSRPAHHGAVVAVRDDGPGVGEDELKRVADLFYTTKDVGKGTGLGLALVHATLREHGGTVHVATEPGRYFLVELRFPSDVRGDVQGDVQGERKDGASPRAAPGGEP